jgi:hypothetical protein
MVDIVAAAISAIGALIGVLVGAWLTGITLRSERRSAEDLRLRQDRQSAYLDLLSASRQMRRHLQSEEVSVRLVPRGDGSAATPVLQGGNSVWQPIEAALAHVELSTSDPAVTNAARALRRSRYDLIRARATHPAGGIPQRVIDDCKTAEDEFSRIARQDLYNKLA